MGYSFRIVESSFSVKRENEELAVKALADSAAAAPRVFQNDIRRAKDNLQMALMAIGWEPEVDGDSNEISGKIYSLWEKISGNELIIFDAIAPYVESGSYIYICGEDGEIWRWYFNGKNCVEQKAKITWE